MSSEGVAEQTEPSSSLPLSPESLPLSASPPKPKASKREIIQLDDVSPPEPEKHISPEVARQTTQLETLQRAQMQENVVELDSTASTCPHEGDGNASELGRGKEGEEEEEDDDECYRNLAASARQRANQNMSSAGEANPVINIFIEPRIPNTLPLMVKRLYLQNFKGVRLAWCQQNIERNLLDKSQESDVIFTWRGRKVFDLQSCKSLGLELDEEGLPTLEDSDGIPQRFDKVAIVATTEKIQSEERRNELAKKAIVMDEPKSSPQQPVENQYRVILRSKDYEDQKIIVKEVCWL